jgi:hypothetical protein
LPRHWQERRFTSGKVANITAVSPKFAEAIAMPPTTDIEAPRATVDAAGAMALLGDNADLYFQVAQAFLTEIAS